MVDLQQANRLIKQFESAFQQSECATGREPFYTGVDLGTAYIVLAVVDKNGIPVAGAMRYAQVVRDGLVVDYIGAVDIVKELKMKLEKQLGVELINAGVAYPPETSVSDQRTIQNVAEAAGFEVYSNIDEPTAANKVLGVANGAVVDIGGGTTGIAIFKNGKVCYVADEPTGGTHFSLVIAGAYQISFEEAEKKKVAVAGHKELLPVVKPVIEKVASIIKTHIQGKSVEKVYLVGGTSCFTGIEKIIEQEIDIEVVKPKNPLLITPLGIALNGVGVC